MRVRHGEVQVKKHWVYTSLAVVFLCGSTMAEAGLYYTPPDWGTPAQAIELPYDAGKTPAENGAVLKAAVLALTAGQRLVVGGGDYYIGSHFGPTLNGSNGAPIVIEANGSDLVEISSDVNHNILDLSGAFVILRELSFTGGSIGIRLHSCHHIWLDRCRIHDTPEAALTANTYNTNNLYITGNEIFNTSGTGEGMYLGANYGTAVMHSSVIADNTVYNTGGDQGDGIELKQGSWGNIIAGNLVHDCNYPCILVYGTDGQPPNTIEGNICYNSNDNVMQVQGEAIVRNNLAVNGAGAAFHTHDHQGQTVNLQVVNNTIVNSGRCTNLASWDGRTGMVFANGGIPLTPVATRASIRAWTTTRRPRLSSTCSSLRRRHAVSISYGSDGLRASYVRDAVA